MKNVFFFNALALMLTFSACNDDDGVDADKPRITSVNFVTGVDAKAGEVMEVRASFTDDENLSEAYFEIHENFDGHKHGKANTKFEASEIISLDGTQDEKTIEFSVPTTAAASPYHLEISVLDKAGNRSDVKVLPFNITQDGQPVFVNLNETMNISSKDFTIDFTVTDDIDLAEIIYELYEHTSNGEIEITDGDIDLDGSDDTSFKFNQNFSAPEGADELEFIVRVTDSDGNLTVGEVEIEVQP